MAKKGGRIEKCTRFFFTSLRSGRVRPAVPCGALNLNSIHKKTCAFKIIAPGYLPDVLLTHFCARGTERCDVSPHISLP